MAWGWVVLLLGCSGDARLPSEPPPVRHFSEWGALVDAAARRDVQTTRILARDLTGGPHPGSDALGAALGFLQVAEAEELADGVAAAAVSCTGCHRERSVPYTPVAPVLHADVGRHLAANVVFGRASGWAPAGVLRSAWTTTEDPEARLSRTLSACARCHQSDPVVDPAVLSKLCASPCGGQVSLWGPMKAPADLLVHSGDLDQCSHVVTTWADLEGVALLSASDHPVEREAAAAFGEKRKAVMGDRVLLGTWECVSE